jgi:hypothetical protein
VCIERGAQVTSAADNPAWNFPPELVAYLHQAATRHGSAPAALMVCTVSTGLPPPSRPKKGAMFCPSQWFADALDQ